MSKTMSDFSRTHFAATVTTAATKLFDGNTSRQLGYIQNLSAGDIYLGTSGVTTANGVKVITGADHFVLADVDAWYAIVATGTADVRGYTVN